MKRTWIAAVLVGLAVAAAASDWEDRRAGVSKTTLARGIAIALREVPGEALDASIELEDGEAVIEVTVYTGGRLVDVKVDGDTGRVLSVEEEEDEEPLRGQST